jgi:hypothetical protein
MIRYIASVAATRIDDRAFFHEAVIIAAPDRVDAHAQAFTYIDNQWSPDYFTDQSVSGLEELDGKYPIATR